MVLLTRPATKFRFLALFELEGNLFGRGANDRFKRLCNMGGPPNACSNLFPGDSGKKKWNRLLLFKI